MGKNDDVKLYRGYAYNLMRVLDIGDKYEAFILECGGDGRYFYADLGRQRYLSLRGVAYLVLVSDRSVKLFRLKADENDLHEGRPVVRVKEVFGKKGIKCKTIADYWKTSYSWGTAWERSLRASKAVFSKYGYATQYYFWNDCNEYDFEICFVKRGHLLIDGWDISSLGLIHGSDDVMKAAREYIELLLTGPAEMSADGFADRMSMIGLYDELKYWNFVVRE